MTNNPLKVGVVGLEFHHLAMRAKPTKHMTAPLPPFPRPLLSEHLPLRHTCQSK